MQARPSVPLDDPLLRDQLREYADQIVQLYQVGINVLSYAKPLRAVLLVEADNVVRLVSQEGAGMRFEDLAYYFEKEICLFNQLLYESERITQLVRQDGFHPVAVCLLLSRVDEITRLRDRGFCRALAYVSTAFFKAGLSQFIQALPDLDTAVLSALSVNIESMIQLIKRDLHPRIFYELPVNVSVYLCNAADQILNLFYEEQISSEWLRTVVPRFTHYGQLSAELVFLEVIAESNARRKAAGLDQDSGSEFSEDSSSGNDSWWSSDSGVSVSPAAFFGGRMVPNSREETPLPPRRLREAHYP